MSSIGLQSPLVIPVLVFRRKPYLVRRSLSLIVAIQERDGASEFESYDVVLCAQTSGTAVLVANTCEPAAYVKVTVYVGGVSALQPPGFPHVLGHYQQQTFWRAGKRWVYAGGFAGLPAIGSGSALQSTSPAMYTFNISNLQIGDTCSITLTNYTSSNLLTSQRLVSLEQVDAGACISGNITAIPSTNNLLFGFVGNNGYQSVVTYTRSQSPALNALDYTNTMLLSYGSNTVCPQRVSVTFEDYPDTFSQTTFASAYIYPTALSIIDPAQVAAVSMFLYSAPQVIGDLSWLPYTTNEIFINNSVSLLYITVVNLIDLSSAPITLDTIAFYDAAYENSVPSVGFEFSVSTLIGAANTYTIAGGSTMATLQNRSFLIMGLPLLPDTTGTASADLPIIKINNAYVGTLQFEPVPVQLAGVSDVFYGWNTFTITIQAPIS